MILQGPCFFRVDSDHGGFLQAGKLTARVENGAGATAGLSSSAGRKVSASNAKSPDNASLVLATSTAGQASSGTLTTSHQTLATSLFAIRTPTATVTDLGTEFGVEVNQKGESRSPCSLVKSSPLRSGASARPVHLKTGDVGRINVGRKIVVEKLAKSEQKFVRVMSRWPHQATILNPSFEQPHILPGELPYMINAFYWNNKQNDQWGVNRFGDQFSEPMPDGEQLGFLNEGEIWRSFPNGSSRMPNTS